MNYQPKIPLGLCGEMNRKDLKTTKLAGRNLAVRMSFVALAALLSFSALTGRGVATDDILNYKGPDREDRLLAGAKQEGEVVFYSTMIVNQAVRPLADGFMKKYPFIKLSFWRATPEDIATKVAAEQRANNVVGDLFAGTGLGELAVQMGIAEPYFTPVLDAYPRNYSDPQGRWSSTNLYYYGLAYNTKLVAPDQAPKTFEDLLDAKWKGKMAWRTGELTGSPLFIANLRLAWGDDKAMAYFTQLKEQNIINFAAGSARTLVDRVIAGDYPIAINIFANHPLISAAKGASVAAVLMDPVPSTASTMVIPKGAPHPYAALLLADYILSVEGQTILANAEYYPARPDVPPLKGIAPVVPRIAGVPENFIGPDRVLAYTTSSEAIYEKLFR